jgi:hypothetical protein
MVSLFEIMRTEHVHSVSVYELEGPRRGAWSRVPRLRSKKSLRYVGRLRLTDLLMLNRGWYDMLVGFDCREKMQKGLWTIMEAAKLDNHLVVDWFTKRKMKQETIVVHVIQQTP